MLVCARLNECQVQTHSFRSTPLRSQRNKIRGDPAGFVKNSYVLSDIGAYASFAKTRSTEMCADRISYSVNEVTSIESSFIPFPRLWKHTCLKYHALSYS